MANQPLVLASAGTPGFLSRTARGVREHPYRAAGVFGGAYVFLWAVMEPAIALVGVESGPWRFGLFVLGALAVAAARLSSPASVSFVMKGTRTPVEICVADLLASGGHIVVAVNEFFDSALGNHVAASSLHGQCIVRLFGGDGPRFEQAADTALAAVPPLETVLRTSGRGRRYAIGTTAAVEHGATKVFLAALSKTDLTTLRASASYADLVTCLDGVWAAVRTHSNGDPVSLPLIGAGQSGVGLSHQALLQVTLISLQAVAQAGQITSPIRVCLTAEVFDRVNLRVVQEEWSS